MPPTPSHSHTPRGIAATTAATDSATVSSTATHPTARGQARPHLQQRAQLRAPLLSVEARRSSVQHLQRLQLLDDVLALGALDAALDVLGQSEQLRGVLVW